MANEALDSAEGLEWAEGPELLRWPRHTEKLKYLQTFETHLFLAALWKMLCDVWPVSCEVSTRRSPTLYCIYSPYSGHWSPVNNNTITIILGPFLEIIISVLRVRSNERMN